MFFLLTITALVEHNYSIINRFIAINITIILCPANAYGFFFLIRPHRCEKSTDTEDYNSVRADMANHSDVSPCKISKSMFVVISILTVLVVCLGVLTMILARKVRFLGRRPRIKKRIVVNKSITPLTHSRQQPDQNQQCEITIENCCNMNICETVRMTGCFNL